MSENKITISLKVKAKFEARALAERAGIDMDDHDFFISDLADTLLRFATAALPTKADDTDTREKTPAEKFSDWLSVGPSLAKDAGCYVGIKVTASLSPNTERAP